MAALELFLHLKCLLVDGIPAILSNEQCLKKPHIERFRCREVLELENDMLKVFWQLEASLHLPSLTEFRYILGLSLV